MDIAEYIQLGVALIAVLALMGLLSFVLKKVNQAQSGMNGKTNRLKIVEQRMIDPKTKALIIRCDDKEHLVISGQNGHTVIKADMDIPKPSSVSSPSTHKKDIPVESL